MSNLHTPGPWHIEIDEDGRQVITDESGLIVCSGFSVEHSALLLAAPEMFAFIKVLVHCANTNAPEPVDLLDQAKDLIKKVGG